MYYGTTASSKDDPTAVWNTYLAQTTNDGTSFQQSLVSNTPNHVGVICTRGVACGFGTRNLLDLFKVAIDPKTGRAAVIYTDDTITKDSSGNPLPAQKCSAKTEIGLSDPPRESPLRLEFSFRAHIYKIR